MVAGDLAVVVAGAGEVMTMAAHRGALDENG